MNVVTDATAESVSLAVSSMEEPVQNNVLTILDGKKSELIN